MKTNESDTIKLTKEEIDEIGTGYHEYSNMWAGTSDWMPFSEYLNKLLQLKEFYEN
jgi:hypothetical protein